MVIKTDLTLSPRSTLKHWKQTWASNTFLEQCFFQMEMYVPWVEFKYPAFTCMPGEHYRRQLRPLLYHSCHIFWALINPLRVWTVKLLSTFSHWNWPFEQGPLFVDFKAFFNIYPLKLAIRAWIFKGLTSAWSWPWFNNNNNKSRKQNVFALRRGGNLSLPFIRQGLFKLSDGACIQLAQMLHDDLGVLLEGFTQHALLRQALHQVHCAVLRSRF